MGAYNPLIGITSSVNKSSTFTYDPGTGLVNTKKQFTAQKADKNKKSIGDAISTFQTKGGMGKTNAVLQNGHGKVDTEESKKLGVGYKYNLPPHQWSLPVNPNRINDNNDGATINGYPAKDFHGLRRARIWNYQSTDYSLGVSDTTTTSAGTTNGLADAGFKTNGIIGPLDAINNILVPVKALSKKVNSLFGAADPGVVSQQNSQYPDTGKQLSSDTKWGFQFLWNPETISNSISLNTSVTPSSSDRFRASAGLFISQENISLEIMIDRTNDFACFAKLKSASNYNDTYKQYYKNAYPYGVPQAFDKQINDLLKLGTMADIEYLYKVINGPGLENTLWTNMLGRETADIGFLTPSIMAMQFGPSDSSLSYVGQAQSLSVTHVTFTQNMVPLRSRVTLGIMVFSGYGSSSNL